MLLLNMILVAILAFIPFIIVLRLMGVKELKVTIDDAASYCQYGLGVHAAFNQLWLTLAIVIVYFVVCAVFDEE